MPTTPNLGLPYPGLTDAPNGPAQIQALAVAVDSLKTLNPVSLAVADVAEAISGGTSQRLLSANTLITLTPGTWRVTGAACLRTTDVVDNVTAIIWNATTSTEVPNSRGTGAGLTSTTVNTGLTVLTRPVFITVAANTNVQVAGVPNGASTLRLNSLATSPVAWIDAQRVA